MITFRNSRIYLFIRLFQFIKWLLMQFFLFIDIILQRVYLFLNLTLSPVIAVPFVYCYILLKYFFRLLQKINLLRSCILRFFAMFFPIIYFSIKFLIGITARILSSCTYCLFWKDGINAIHLNCLLPFLAL